MSDAHTVTLSYPADLSTWGRDRVEHDSFRAYLRKAHGTAEPGEVWAEFVGVGCCGSALDVPLRVEAVAGSEADDEEEAASCRNGDRQGAVEIAEDTAFEFTVREACDLEDGWAVQSGNGR